jgi:hypothetical protein
MAFGLLIPAILDLGTTNVLATTRLQGQRSTVYASDGAMDGAIQYLRRNPGCARPFGSCPATSFVATLDNKTATVTWTALGVPLALDRTVRLTSTVDGTPRVTTEVVISDSSTAAEPPVDVKSWRYNR